MKNTENAWKLKRTANEKGKNAIDTAWKSKPLHGQQKPPPPTQPTPTHPSQPKNRCRFT